MKTSKCIYKRSKLLYMLIILIVLASCDKTREKQEIEEIKTAIEANKVEIAKIHDIVMDLNIIKANRYYEVITKEINIRTGPGVRDNRIAKASTGAIFKKITEIKNSRWVKIEYIVNEIPYTGYIKAQKDYVREISLSVIEYYVNSNRGYVKQNWIGILSREIRSKNIKTIMVSLRLKNKSLRTKIMLMISRTFEEKEIYAQIVYNEKTEMTKSNIHAMSTEYGVDEILDIMSDESNNITYTIYNRLGAIIYVETMALNIMELENNEE
jgi:hypothetical protein